MQPRSLRFVRLFWQVRTVKVSNVSLGASEQDIKEFFSFSGEIEYVDIQRLVPIVHLDSGVTFYHSDHMILKV